MNRQRLLGLLAGSLVTAVMAVPAFAEGPSDNASAKAKAAVAGARGQSAEKGAEKANRVLAALAKRRAVQGELTAAKAVSSTVELTLETKRAGKVVVVANADTKLHGKGHDTLTLDGVSKLTAGARIIAQGERDGEKLVAKHLIVRPAKVEKDEKDEKDPKEDAAKKRTVTTGVVGGITTNTSNVITGFTVTPQGGSAVTYVANADTQYQLKGVAGLAKDQTVRVASVKNDAGQNVAKQVRVSAGS